MDSVGGMVGNANFSSKEDKLATIDLRIDYLQGAKAFWLVEDNLVHLGNKLMVTSTQAFQEGQLVAEGKVVYNFIKSKSLKLNIWNIF